MCDYWEEVHCKCGWAGVSAQLSVSALWLSCLLCELGIQNWRLKTKWAASICDLHQTLLPSPYEPIFSNQPLITKLQAAVTETDGVCGKLHEAVCCSMLAYTHWHSFLCVNSVLGGGWLTAWLILTLLSREEDSGRRGIRAGKKMEVG